MIHRQGLSRSTCTMWHIHSMIRVFPVRIQNHLILQIILTRPNDLTRHAGCRLIWALALSYPKNLFLLVLGIGQNFTVVHQFCKTDWSSINNRLVENIFSLNLAIFQILIHCVRSFRGIQIIFFLFLHENICCVYSLEVPLQGASNEYPQVPQHLFSWRNKKNISTFWLTV